MTAEGRYPVTVFKAAREQHEYDALRKAAVLLERARSGSADADVLVDEATGVLELRMAAVKLGANGEWTAASILQGEHEDPFMAELEDEISMARRTAAERQPASPKKAKLKTSAGAAKPTTASAAPVAATTTTTGSKATVKCFRCNGSGHKADACPSPKGEPAAPKN